MSDIDRRGLLAGFATLPFAFSVKARSEILLRPIRGRMRQGGHLIFQTDPSAIISLDDRDVTIASRAGLAFVGFDRDAPASTRLGVRSVGAVTTRSLHLAPGSF